VLINQWKTINKYILVKEFLLDPDGWGRGGVLMKYLPIYATGLIVVLGGLWNRASVSEEDSSRFYQVKAAEAYLKENGECRGCNLKQSELAGLDLSSSDLTGANLQGTDLSSADLTGANLKAALLRRADLSSVLSLKGADFTGADLTEANIRDKDLNEAVLCQTVLPDGSLFESCAPRVLPGKGQPPPPELLEISSGDRKGSS
jgi:hypothetical protein